MQEEWTNADLAEALAQAAEEITGPVQKAMRRASTQAFLWPIEATDLLKQKRSLQELDGIGPHLEKVLTSWMSQPKPELKSPLLRQGFLTLAQARSILQAHPEWRRRAKGNLHMHSQWSDGSGSIEAMAEAAFQNGYSYIAICDHSKGLKIAGGIDENKLKAQSQEIDQLNQTGSKRWPKFQILRSIEMNLSPTGDGDLDPSALENLDLVIGSFHSALRRTEDQTERYLAGLKNPHIQILGHPRGRIYNFRAGLSADWSRVFAEAAKEGKALEVDGFPDRQDLDVDLLALAREHDIFISLASDAHRPEDLFFLEFALAAACIARIRPERILNFMTRHQLLHWGQTIRARQRA